jgi:hypothetical protein
MIRISGRAEYVRYYLKELIKSREFGLASQEPVK